MITIVCCTPQLEEAAERELDVDKLDALIRQEIQTTIQALKKEHMPMSPQRPSARQRIP